MSTNYTPGPRYRCALCRKPFHAISGAVYCCGFKPPRAAIAAATGAEQ